MLGINMPAPEGSGSFRGAAVGEPGPKPVSLRRVITGLKPDASTGRLLAFHPVRRQRGQGWGTRRQGAWH